MVFTPDLTFSALNLGAEGDLLPLRSVPKADLHAHVLLSAPYKCYWTLSNETLSPPPVTFGGLSEFVSYVFNNILPLLSHLGAHRKVIREAFAQMVLDGVVYTEPVFDVFAPVRINASWKQYAAMIQEEVNRVQSELRVRPELGFGRERDHNDAYVLATSAIETGIFKGVDLYGDELSKPIEVFLPYFALARSFKLKIKLHTGEIGNSDRMWHEIQMVKPDAVQHGISAASNIEVLRYLKDNEIPLNICPTSNCSLSITELSQHPIRKIFDAGVTVTINTDDYGLFGTSLSEEYIKLYKAGVLGWSELETIRRNGLYK